MSLIDRIRKQLDQPGGLTMEAIEPLAEEYGLATEAANARLLECVRLLRKGLRAEAIQRAEMKPKLIELAANLDFPEMDEWVEILKFYGIQVPTLLDRDAATQLQEAVVEEQPLEEILRQHRRLAIAKAPLSWRLRVLRRLAHLDAKNPVWREDQAQWEVIRLKQVGPELGKAISSKSLPLLQEIHEELNRKDWIVSPPREIVERASEALDAFNYEDQVGRLRAIGERLHLAYSEGNELQVKQAYNEWIQVLNEMKQNPPDYLTESVEPAIEWLQERISESETMDRYHELCAELELLLQNNSSISNLEQKHHELKSLQLEIPALLQQRLQTRTHELRLAARRKTQLIYFFATGTAVSLIVLIGLWQWSSGHAAVVAKSAQRLEELLDAGDLVGADKFVELLKRDAPAVSKSTPLLDLIAKLSTKNQEEDTRSQRVASIISELKSKEPSELDPIAINRALKEAKTREENAAIATIRQSLEKYQRELQESDIRSFTSALESLESKLAVLQQKKLTDVLESEIESLIVDARKLNSAFPKAASQMSTSLDLFTRKAGSFKSSLQTNNRNIAMRQQAMTGLRRSRHLSAFENEMESYVSQLPGDPLAEEFADSIREKKLWTAIDDWNRCCRSLRSALEGGLSEAELTQLVTELDSVDKKIVFGKSDFVKTTANELRLQLDMAKKRREELVALAQYFQKDSSFLELVTLVFPGGKDPKLGRRRFITNLIREENADKFRKLTDSSKTTLQAISSQNGSSTEAEFRGKLTIVDEPRVTMQITARMLRVDEAKFMEQWDTSFLKLLNDLENRPSLDGQLKEVVLYEVVSTFRKGSVHASENLESLEKELHDSIAGKQWFEMADVNTKLPPSFSDALRNGTKKIESIQKSQLARLTTFSSRSITWVGAVLRDSQDNLSPWLSEESLPPSKLYTIVPNDGSAGAGSDFGGQLIEVGQIVEHTGRLSDRLGEGIAHPGRPLFVVSTSQAPSSTSK
jgi:hypothetical protein